MRIAARLLFAPLLLLPFCAANAATVIHAGALIDGKADAAAGASTLIVDSGRITAVLEGHRAAQAGDTLIDLSDHTVLPGLIDMHTHLTSQLGRGTYVERFRLSEADYALQASTNARRTLHAGFTTVRDLGDQYNVSVALRNAIARGSVTGPRILTAAKAIGTTGGHADPTNGWAPRIAGNPGPKEGVVNSVDDAAKAVRQRYKDGADLIKITATGGVLSLAKNGQNPQFSEAEVAAVVATAKDYGFHVAAHAHGAE
ncbi:MAG: amidohydrolase family protein, partial [Pseudomonadota bacterium]